MGHSVQNMKPAIPMNRLDDRRRLLTGLDRIQASQDSTGTLDGIDKLRQQAFDVILGGVSEAFDLSKEDPVTVARYDTSSAADCPLVFVRRAKGAHGPYSALALAVCAPNDSNQSKLMYAPGDGVVIAR
jgi:hypothetical protein